MVSGSESGGGGLRSRFCLHPPVRGRQRPHPPFPHAHLTRAAGFHAPGTLFPVSAAILRDRRSYDSVLENLSRPFFEAIHRHGKTGTPKPFARIPRTNSASSRSSTGRSWRFARSWTCRTGRQRCSCGCACRTKGGFRQSNAAASPSWMMRKSRQWKPPFGNPSRHEFAAWRSRRFGKRTMRLGNWRMRYVKRTR